MPASDTRPAGETRQRIDKWLWFARIVRTREAAASLVEAGHVRINRSKVTKPGHDVKPGDMLTIVLNTRVRVLEVRDLAPRRGQASAAVLLYRETSASGPGMPDPEGSPPQKGDASGTGNC